MELFKFEPPVNHSMFLEDSFETIQEFIMKNCIQVEEDVIKEILRKILNREPTIDDVKDCTMLSISGVFDEYTFSYRGVTLGLVKRHYGTQDPADFTPKFSVSFILAT